jgi:MoaA/NifB/PqqE/SkfB family radical SAM enzyme
MNCNLRCTMCPWLKLHSPTSLMSWEVFEKIAENFNQAEEVDFTGGGEPLLHPRLEDMIRVAKDCGCTVGFSTNASLLVSKRAETILVAGVDWIAYSVDAATASTYESIRVGASFGRVIENIQRVRDLKRRTGSGKPRTMLFFVMMKENIHELPEMIDLAHSLGIDFVVAKNLDVILKEGDEAKGVFGHNLEKDVDLRVASSIEEAVQKAEKHGLPFRVYELSPTERAVCEQNPLKTLFVSWDGFVSPCIGLSYMEDRCFGKEWRKVSRARFGNIASETLDNIWHKTDYEHFRKLFQDRMNVRAGRLMVIAASGSEKSNQIGTLPSPPVGCNYCYYLHGV